MIQDDTVFEWQYVYNLNDYVLLHNIENVYIKYSTWNIHMLLSYFIIDVHCTHFYKCVNIYILNKLYTSYMNMKIVLYFY